jgi:hypothetical protein
VRCQPYLLELHTLARVEAGPAPTAAEVGRATGAIIAEVGAAGRAALAAAGHGHRHPGAVPFLQVRLNRLTATAEEAIAAARDGDSASLRRVLHRFEALTSAIWTVQDAVRGPALPAQPASSRTQGEPLSAGHDYGRTGWRTDTRNAHSPPYGSLKTRPWNCSAPGYNSIPSSGNGCRRSDRPASSSSRTLRQSPPNSPDPSEPSSGANPLDDELLQYLLVLCSLKSVNKAAAVGTVFRLGPSQIQGRARALSWAVASRVAWAMSSGSAKSCPASAWR